MNLEIGKHEVVIKFPRAQKKSILELLKNSFSEIKVAQGKDSRYMLAHCLFQGQLQRLDQELRVLQSKAILICGEKSEGGMLEFFMELGEIARPRLLGGLEKTPQHFRSEKLVLYLVLAGVFATGVFLLAPSFFKLMESKMESRQQVAVRNPWTKAPNPSWNKFVMPQHQGAWLAVQAEFNLSDKLMLELFPNIKDVGHYGYGRIWNDLTVYPEIMERALGLIVLKNIRSPDDLTRLTKDLKTRYLYSRPFPDEKQNQDVNMRDFRSGNGIILVFYEDVLLKKKDFCKILIGEVRKEVRKTQIKSTN